MSNLKHSWHTLLIALNCWGSKLQWGCSDCESPASLNFKHACETSYLHLYTHMYSTKRVIFRRGFKCKKNKTIYIHIYIYTYIYLNIYINTSIYIYIYIYLYLYIFIYSYIYIDWCDIFSMCMYLHALYIHACIHTYRHTCLSTCTCDKTYFCMMYVSMFVCLYASPRRRITIRTLLAPKGMKPIFICMGNHHIPATTFQSGHSWSPHFAKSS